MNKFLWILIISFQCISVNAQDTINFRYGYIPEAKITFLAVDGIIDPKNFLEGSYEHKIDKRQSVEYALGVYLPRSIYTPYVETINNESFKVQNSGFRLRINWKIYSKMYWGSHFKNNYFAPELMFNYLNVKSIGWHNRFEDAFQQYMSASKNQTYIGLGLRFGEQLFMSQKSKKILLDYFGGIGIRTLIISKGKSTPDDVTTFNGESAFPYTTRRTPGTYWHPYINIGLKLGFVLKK